MIGESAYLLNSLPNRQQTVVDQQRSLLVAKALRDVLALFLRQNHAVEALVDDMVVVERTTVLRKTVQLPAQRAPSPSINTMTVRRAHNIGPRFMDGTVDHIRRSVQESILSTSDHFAGVVDENEVGLVHQAESAAEGVHPETIGLDGVAEGDVTCDALVVAVFAEDAEGGCEAAFEVFALFVLVFEGWGSGGARNG